MLAIIRELFGAIRAICAASNLCESKFSVLPLFLLLPINTSATTLVQLLVPRFSAVAGFLSISGIILQFCAFFLSLGADPRRRPNYYLKNQLYTQFFINGLPGFYLLVILYGIKNFNLVKFIAIFRRIIHYQVVSPFN